MMSVLFASVCGTLMFSAESENHTITILESLPIRGKDFVAVKTTYQYEYAAPGRKPGSRWTQFTSDVDLILTRHNWIWILATWLALNPARRTRTCVRWWMPVVSGNGF